MSLFTIFFDRRTSTDNRNFKLCIDSTMELALKVGGGEIIRHIIDRLQDESDLLRKMTIEVIYKISMKIGFDDLEVKLEEPLIDSLLLNFQYYENEDKDNYIINCISYTLKALKYRAKKFINQIFEIKVQEISRS